MGLQDNIIRIAITMIYYIIVHDQNYLKTSKGE
jgi:hypothetical protein